uniref:Uncharacterized protein n=1 Tax=Rhodosorus marinus TaxID=101924 RepID=A0A7S3ENZ2_9RHOD|mmetsp:Transcript_5860/g.24620  ORF Transcript_5860/g.24620 Transcript_5860/m.24620 type:complete len:243 (+) Transcript_5860:140-868(+)
MVKAITVEEIQLVVPMSYGRRRTRRRIWDLPADTVEFDELKYPRAGEYLTEKSISFEVEMEAEEALFYGNSWMSDIECRAVTDWLKKFEDETLELFADALEKEVDHGKQFFRELVSGEVQDVTASGLMEVEADLKELIGGLQQRIDVVFDAAEQARLADGSDARTDESLASSNEDEPKEANFLEEASQERNVIENRLQSFWRGVFLQKQPNQTPEEHRQSGSSANTDEASTSKEAVNIDFYI